MAFCTECGFRLAENVAFCPNCGHRVNNESGEAPQTTEAYYSSPVSAPPPYQADSVPPAAFEQRQNDAPGGAYFSGQNYHEASNYGYSGAQKSATQPPKGDGNSKTAIIVIVSVIALLMLAVILIISATRKNATPSPASTPAGSSKILEPQESLPGANHNTIAGSGYIDNRNYYIAFTGAEEFIDLDNEPAIRIYYEFTNYFEYPQCAWDVIEWTIRQDGIELEDAYAWEDPDVYYYDSLNIRSGLTIQCCFQYKYNPDGGKIDLTLYGWDSGESAGKVTCTYVPGSFPGAPAPYAFAPYPEPQWTLELDSEGYLDDGDFFVAVTDAELIDDYYGDPAIRIYYEFGNYSGEAVSMYYALDFYAYQDGVALYWTYADTDSDTDKNLQQDINHGEHIIASCVFQLRNNTSGVEAEVESWYTYGGIGQTYRIN